MPLPMGHTLAAYAICEGNRDRLRFFDKPWQTLLFFAVLANLPDIDFLPGFLLGNPNRFHHGFVHSLGAAVAVGFLGALYFRRRYGRFWPYFGLIAATYYSHLILDFFNQDMRAPYGVMLFWPLDSTYYMSPVALFASVHKSSDSSTFIQSLFTMHNFWVALRELLLMGPLAAGTYFYNKRRRSRSPRKSVTLRLAKVKYFRQRAQGAPAYVELHETRKTPKPKR